MRDNFFISLALSLLLTPQIHALKIGILGDSHGELSAFQEALTLLAEQEVTHLIGTGDFVRWEGPEGLETMLSQMEALTGVSKGKTFLIPGNWEHETNFPVEVMNQVLRHYGNLVFENYDSSGILEIEGIKIFLSHFPQHPLPEDFLPPPRFRRKLPGQAYVMETIERKIHPPRDAALAIFAHTHIGGAFLDSQSKVVVINPGVLNHSTKTPEEPLAVAVFSPAEQNVSFYDVEKKRPILRIDLAKATSCHAQLKSLLKEQK